MPTAKLQRYQVMEPLGPGGKAHTYLAIDRDTGDEVAIKVMSLHGASEWKDFEMFEREAKVLAGLQHPGIPRYRDYFASDESGDYFLVMDLVHGRSLAEALADKVGPTAPRLDEAGLRRIMNGMLDILEYLHGRVPPVIHRDIKPANVILDPSGGVHLVDFGAVRVLGSGGATMVGTFGYMAPEQLHGEAGPGADLYALGATIVALATGKPADELPHQGLAIDLDAFPLPARLRPVLRALLEPDPRRRVSSVAQVRALLGEPYREPSRPQRTPPPPEPSGPLAIPNIVVELARTPKPLSILVWLVSLFGVAILSALEFVVLPVLYMILRVAADNQTNKGQAVDDDKSGITSLREFRRTASHQRQLVSYVIRNTSPLRDDDPPALPPGER
jgi:serine/threonine protein kinase